MKGTRTTKSFADRLDELIAECGKDIREISSDSTVASGALSNYRSDHAESGINNLVKIANYFNVSTDYLLGLTMDPERKPSAVDELGLTPEAIKKIKADNRENKRIRISLSSFINHAVEGKDTKGINYIDGMEGIIKWAIIHGAATINSEKKYDDLMEENADLVMEVYNYNAAPIPANDAIDAMKELVVNKFRDLLNHYFEECLAKTINNLNGGKRLGDEE